MEEKITQEKLKEVLDYNQDTGVFTWKYSRRGAKKGAIAGGLCNGYVIITIFKKFYYAHRLAWLYMEGYFPKNIEIDHIDRIKNDNKWDNLRLASRQCNLRNTGNPATNTSGVKGVGWHKHTMKWGAHIYINGKVKYLGIYKDFKSAVQARFEAEQSLNWNKCDSNSPAYQYLEGLK